MIKAEIIVIGGGMLGPAIAGGMTQGGADVVMLDEGDVALRAARGNFGIVWYQSKGLGEQHYAEWTLESIGLWQGFADRLEATTGVAIDYQKPGGLILCIGDEELEERRSFLSQMRQQAGGNSDGRRMLDRAEIQALLPDIEISAAVTGGSFCPHDGQVNPLYLIRAMHAAFIHSGGRYYPGHKATAIERAGGDFVVTTESGRFSAAKVVLAAGHGIAKLAPMVDLRIPLVAERGQILVTERTRPILPVVVSQIRQTGEGCLMLGATVEDVGLDDGTTSDATAWLAEQAIERFPALRHLRLVRTWGCIRVYTPDKLPIYAESKTQPGAYAVACHSGVTLAAIHAEHIARWIWEGVKPPYLDKFSPERFHV
jgi:glycine/D-amino acid oxidase-like deaminating enzyme